MSLSGPGFIMTPTDYCNARNGIDRAQEKVEQLISARASTPEFEAAIAELRSAKAALEKLLLEATPEERKAVSIARVA